jgi:TatD DNase family protein
MFIAPSRVRLASVGVAAATSPRPVGRPLLIDSHCHLNHPLIKDRDAVIGRAGAANVSQMITISCELHERDELVQLAQRFKGHIFCTVGIHPHWSGTAQADAMTSQQVTDRLLADKQAHPAEIVAFGECGLDFFKNQSPADSQRRVFKAQMDAAIAADIPVVVHSRDADDEMMAMIAEYKGKLKGVLHCFNGGPDMARKALELGFYVSISGIITFAPKHSSRLRDIVRDIVPLDRLLVETDSPFLAPHPHRGKGPCEPAFVVHTAEQVATTVGLPIDELAAATVRNTRRLFSLPDHNTPLGSPAC